MQFSLIVTFIILGVLQGAIALPANTSAVEHALVLRGGCGGDGQRCCAKGDPCNWIFPGGNCCSNLHCLGGDTLNHVRFEEMSGWLEGCRDTGVPKLMYMSMVPPQCLP
ncbi:hypothetical protein C8R43DRAFT_945266 [Mycena crocata]|nr:hypothetical protein C8R43DRAFT_945266 [Mycena crocata]